MAELTRRRKGKIIVELTTAHDQARFGFGDTEVESAVLFALRYAKNIGAQTRVWVEKKGEPWNGEVIAEFDGWLQHLPKLPPPDRVDVKSLQRRHKPKRKKVRHL